MPNGGSDCCGTCWFNSTHEGKVGYFKAAPGTQTRCVIRDLTIEDPFWTYCVNHPHHNPERIDLPTRRRGHRTICCRPGPLTTGRGLSPSTRDITGQQGRRLLSWFFRLRRRQPQE